MVAGRKPNLERWRQVEELRAAGLSLPEIGRRLGCTHQAVASVLHNIQTTRARVRSVACAGCGEPIISAGCLPSDRGKALCLSCLAERPEAPFGRRLLAFRLAAGLTRAELAACAGIHPSLIHYYEVKGTMPRWDRIVPLIQVLGVDLVALGFEHCAGVAPGNSRGTDEPARPPNHRPRKPR
jgi:transcriptional regulator with XRE-family HTH domain